MRQKEINVVTCTGSKNYHPQNLSEIITCKYINRKISNEYKKTEAVIYKKEQHTNTQLSLNIFDV